MVLNLYLLRHAETEYNSHRSIIGGRSNFLGLSERGVKQAKALGKRLKAEGISFDEVYSSTALRTRKTTEIVVEYLDFPNGQIIFSDDLLELSQGDWEGKKRVNVYTPNVLEQMAEQHWSFKAPNGESQKDVEKRVYSWIERNLMNKENHNSTTAIFGHGLATKCLTRRIMDSNPSLTYRISIDNCSISQFKYAFDGEHKGWSLIKTNDNSHLSECGFMPTDFV